jgi:diguanylate cyclase (GGDEF)-like protein/PAS domain S-box-containing protein
VFLLSLLVTGWLLGEYRQLRAGEQQEAVNRASERTLHALRSQLEGCGQLLRSIQALFLGTGTVEPEGFQRIYAVLRPRESFAGLQAVAFARRSAVGEPLSYVTELVAPAVGNERLFGLDVVSQPGNLEAVELARDIDQPVMSRSFRLIQRSGFDEPIDGIVIRVPVFSAGEVPRGLAERRAREVGSVAMSFRVSELIHAGLRQTFDPLYQVQVVDVTDGGADLLYDSHAHGRTAGGDPAADAVTGRLVYGGRIWEVVLWPVAATAGSDLPLLLGWLAGPSLGLLLALLVWSLVSRRDHALALADSLSRRFRESEARFRALNEVLPVAVVLARADGRLDYVNETGRRLLALGENEIAGSQRRLADFIEHGPQPAAEGADAPLGPAQLMRAADGHRFWASVAEREFELAGEAMRLAVISDISELRELTERLSYQASHDSLTGLINRREFERRIEQALDPLHPYHCAALLYLDLDQFKLVNDVSGHLAGDQLLAQLGGMLRLVLAEDDLIARLGGDEFGVLVGHGDRAAVLATAERLRGAIDDFSFGWESRSYGVTASIGAVMLDVDHPRPLRELLSLADTACYLAKEGGRNRIHLFAEDDLATGRRLREMEWITRLRWALAEERFVLYYQELRALRPAQTPTGAHFELLLRLRDENDELVLPGAFVPAAERFGLMPQLDRWVVRNALQNFNRLHPAGEAVALCAINLSATTMEDEAFPAFVLEELRRSGVPAGRVCFEVTETAAVGNMARVVDLIKRLRALGCKFALDDFGAGMSSFGYLKNLPVDYIKIDGSFIRELETDPMSYSIVRAVTDIGHQMGAGVIAEFVNSARTRELLRGLGVDFVQGFAIHKPEPAGMPTPQAA